MSCKYQISVKSSITNKIIWLNILNNKEYIISDYIRINPLYQKEEINKEEINKEEIIE